MEMGRSMEDQRIIEALYERSEDAIRLLDEQFGKLCKRIAFRVLNNEQDAEECVNDTFLAVWNKIPPENPKPLSSYICKICKNIAIKRYHANTAKKRDSHYDLVLEELEECLTGCESVEGELIAKELAQAVNDFLSKLTKTDRIIFMKRYWFLETISGIADDMGKSKNYIAVHLYRSRKKLNIYLKTKGLI